MAYQLPLRLATALVACTFVLLASAGSVAAKFPYFSVQLEPAELRPGDPITVTVRTWADADHSQPSYFAYERPLTDLMEFQLTRDSGGRVRVPVPLEIVEPGLFRGQVTLPPGEWRLVTFPHGRGADTDAGRGYPEPISVRVPEEVAWSGWLPVGLASAVAALAVAAVARAGRIRIPPKRFARRSTTTS